MLSDDGLPLAGAKASQRILMSGVYDAQNTGFQFNYDVQGGPNEQAGAVGNLGHEPVIVTPVSYKVWFPTKITGVLKSYDFGLRETLEAAISDANEISQGGPTPYMDLLNIEQRGGPGALPLDQATLIAIQGDADEQAGPVATSELTPLSPLMRNCHGTAPMPIRSRPCAAPAWFSPI